MRRRLLNLLTCLSLLLDVGVLVLWVFCCPECGASVPSVAQSTEIFCDSAQVT